LVFKMILIKETTPANGRFSPVRESERKSSSMAQFGTKLLGR
jgi:hypothetical protein